MRLQDRVAFVTGASHGIGRGIAIAFAREGAKLAINYNASPDGAAETARQIREIGGEVESYQGDAGNRAQMEKVFHAIIERFGKLDVYVNNANAGLGIAGVHWHYLDVSEEMLDGGFYPSYKAAFTNGQLAARQMIAQGTGGQIINVTSVHQERAWMTDSVYGSQKAAVRRLTMSQALELAQYGIRANAVAPGFIDIRAYPGELGEDYDRSNELAVEQIPLGRGLTEDIAATAVYLASDDSKYVTGVSILVDGGMLLPAAATV